MSDQTPVGEQPEKSTGVAPSTPQPEPKAPWEIGAEPKAPWEISQTAATPPPVEPPLSWSPGQAASYVNTPPVYHRPVPGDVDPTDPFARLPEYRQSSPEASDKARKALIGSFIAIGVFLLVFLIVELAPFPVPAPNGMINYVAADNSYRMDIPNDWSIKNFTSKASKFPNDETTIRSGSAKIDVMLGSMGDVTMNMIMTGGSVTPDDFKDPAYGLHMVSKWRGVNTHSHYHEYTPKPVDTKFGPAEYSEFTGKGGLFGWGGMMHGYRATTTNGEHTIMMILECRQSDWETLSPTFMRVIQSIGPADGSSYKPDPSLTDQQPATQPPDGAQPSGGVTTIDTPNAQQQDAKPNGRGGDYSGDY